MFSYFVCFSLINFKEFLEIFASCSFLYLSFLSVRLLMNNPWTVCATVFACVRVAFPLSLSTINIKSESAAIVSSIFRFSFLSFSAFAVIVSSCCDREFLRCSRKGVNYCEFLLRNFSCWRWRRREMMRRRR